MHIQKLKALCKQAQREREADDKMIDEWKKMVTQHKLIEEFLKRNPGESKEHLRWRVDGRLEWQCEHGVGHTVWVPLIYEGNKNIGYEHGCDGCCKHIKDLRDIK